MATADILYNIKILTLDRGLMSAPYFLYDDHLTVPVIVGNTQMILGSISSTKSRYVFIQNNLNNLLSIKSDGTLNGAYNVPVGTSFHMFTFKSGISFDFERVNNSMGRITMNWFNPVTQQQDSTQINLDYLYDSSTKDCFIAFVSNGTYTSALILNYDNGSSIGWRMTINDTSQGYPINILEKSIAGDDPYSTDENETPAGGYGSFDYTGDDDLPPSLPTLSAAQVGFVSLWNPSQQEMKDLANYLWTGTFDLTNFKKLFTDPMECILSVGIVPVTPTTGTATEIVFGGSSHSGVNAKPITSQFVTVDLGKAHINGQSASALDYSPYVKVSIFLPYCGTYALDADDVMDADVELEYHIDIYTGACVAYLTITKTNSDGSTLHSTLYQFTGNCLASIPITGNDHSQFIQSMLFMGAAVAATVATSGAGAPAIEGAAASGDVAGASAVNAVTASSAVNSVMSMKPNVLRSGNLSSTAGLLGKQRPCITVTWPNLCRPDTEYKLLGMPVHKSGALSDFEGFTIVSAVHVENILCTEIEKQMIEQMLYKGVMV